MIRSETQIQIIGLFQSGKSLVDIAETCDCSTQQVRRLLKAAGIYDGKQEQSKNAIRNANNRKGKNNIAAYVKKKRYHSEFVRARKNGTGNHGRNLFKQTNSCKSLKSRN